MLQLSAHISWVRDMSLRIKPKKVAVVTLSSSGLDDPALHADHRRVRAIVGAELREDVLDSALHGFLRDRKLGGDFLVCIPGGDQPEHINFSRRQRFIS